jgi:hypothetical protein
MHRENVGRLVGTCKAQQLSVDEDEQEEEEEARSWDLRVSVRRPLGYGRRRKTKAYVTYIHTALSESLRNSLDNLAAEAANSGMQLQYQTTIISVYVYIIKKNQQNQWQ